MAITQPFNDPHNLAKNLRRHPVRLTQSNLEVFEFFSEVEGLEIISRFFRRVRSDFNIRVEVVNHLKVLDDSVDHILMDSVKCRHI